MITKKSFASAIKFTVLALFIFGITISCNKEEDEVKNPTILVTLPTSPNQLVEVGDLFSLAFTAESNSSGGENLSRFLLTSRFMQEAAETIVDSAISGKSFTYLNDTLRVRDEVGTQVFTITIYSGSEAKKSASVTFDILADNALNPIIQFKPGNYISGNTTLETNTPISLGINAEMNPNTGSKLAGFTVRRKYEATSTQIVFDTSFAAKSQYTWTGSSVAHPNAGNELWTFTVTDSTGRKGIISFTITTETGGPGMSSYTGLILGSTSTSEPHGINLTEGITYNLEDLTMPEEYKMVDLVYFQDFTQGHCLVSPKQNSAALAYPAIGSWGADNRKITYVAKKPTITAAQFNGIETLSALIVTLGGNVGTTQFYYSEITFPKGFEVNDVFAVETTYAGGGNQGLMLITEINEGTFPAETTIKFDLKIEND
ncbi:MAG: hypothetical protein KDC05_01945 [Bacteroidales bacterium]|nr:hypothetical protein [Bacteroidales bacterium]